MSNKILLGSGLIGLLCKEILGPTWKLIPFKKSRYYTFNPPLADNFIVHHPSLDDLGFLGGLSPRLQKRGFSIEGELIYRPTPIATNPWAIKTGLTPNAAQFDTLRSLFPIYRISCNELYARLMKKYLPSIKSGLEIGTIRSISDGIITTDTTRIGYDRIISTIPLSALVVLLGHTSTLKSRPTTYFLVRASGLDLESCDQVLVCDRAFDFYKVNVLSGSECLFFMVKDVRDPLAYFSVFMEKVDVLHKTTMADVIPIGGASTELNLCKQNRIIPIGSHAQHDYFMDVSSCIKKIMSLTQT